jgi:anti-anti-sigma factor
MPAPLPEVEDIRSKLNLDYALGEKIHRALLIDPVPENLPGISIFEESCISREIDGDFISFFRHSEFSCDLVLGDVMGKGLPSALVGTAVRGKIAHIANPPSAHSYAFDHNSFWHEDIPSIQEILTKVHEACIDRLLALEYFVSLFYGRIDLRIRTFSFIDCGFTKPLHYRKALGEAFSLSNTHFPLGTVSADAYTPLEVHYEAGDFFLIYSDGITCAQSPKGDLFGEAKLKELVERHAHLLPNQLSNLIKEEVKQFTQEEKLEDDLTLLVIKIESLAPLPPLKSSIAKFNSILSQLNAVRTLTREICSKSPGNTEKLSNEMQLAIDEAFTNIVLHGYEKKAGFPVYIRGDYLEDRLMIEISDQGKTLNPLEIPEINLFGDRDHGYGWYLIRQIADRVSYIPKRSQKGWNHLRLYKHYCFRKGDNMELTASEKEGALIIRLESETLDSKQVPEFKQRVLDCIHENNADRVVFDLQKLQFIDSSGLGAFLSLLRQVNTREGHLSLAAMSKSVRTIFELVSMQKIFECYETVNQAIQAHAESKTQ